MENSKRFSCEISWEVCNKVGGIYTVLRTKACQALSNFGENYLLIGPALQHNDHFIATRNPFLDKVRNILDAKGIKCQVGTWDIEEDSEKRPMVILVEYKDRYDIDALLYGLWSDYGIDSLASNYDYYEPILFSTAAAQVVEVLGKDLLDKDTSLMAHCHEWLAGAALLYLKKNYCDVATIFTIHATVLGRALSGNDKLVYNLPENFDPGFEARKFGVFAKHSLERAAAQNADCFTAVSALTAEEANLILGKYPDKILPNGLDLEGKCAMMPVVRKDNVRNHLLDIASKVVGKEFSSTTKLWMTSGRFEFHNKGFDLLLQALDELDKCLPENAPDIVMFFCVAVLHRNFDQTIIRDGVDPSYATGLTVFKNEAEHNDPIITACKKYGFNQGKRKIQIVYSDAYLDGDDGVFNLEYEHVLANMDLTLFLSFYEPWGYTPPESLAYATPTVTTDLSGFGDWMQKMGVDFGDALYVLPRKNRNLRDVINALNKYLLQILEFKWDDVEPVRKRSLELVKLVDWKSLYVAYLDAYAQAIEFKSVFYGQKKRVCDVDKFVTLIKEPESTKPRFRSLHYEALLPEALTGLRSIAYNFWWSWHESVKILFRDMDPKLWVEVKRNPVHFLNAVSNNVLQNKIADANFMREYKDKLDFFNLYISERNIPEFCNPEVINFDRPIAYFCMEYALDECFPVYSGGLGILAGDYLKTMSDLNVPLVAVGFFYQDGYFVQSVDSNGEQVALYESQNLSQIPMRKLADQDGKEILISIDLPDRELLLQVWEANVGRIKLYLLDSNVVGNSEQDREITNRLYAGLRERRLVQEIVLGIGGARLLEEKLNIKPAIYHMNEGHSAFLLLERIKNYFQSGLSFAEACEAVRSSSVFTTHTPVPAGNEVFANQLIHKYFMKMQESIGISIDDLIKDAQDVSLGTQVFSMTALALKFSVGANAVSAIHGKIARAMWQGIWNGFLESEVPIGAITNGIHVSTWIGNPMKDLLDEFLGHDWKLLQRKPELWKKIAKIPNSRLWQTHIQQKNMLLEAVRERVMHEYAERNESKQVIYDSLNALAGNCLVVGLARRFASYKRSTLILRDRERLQKIILNSEREVVLLVAGKAHPQDTIGKGLLKTYIDATRDSAFKGHIIFLENYDMTLAKLLVQGVDVWLNMPTLGREACGTSGMKAGLNGALNFSIRDGWWDEAYRGFEEQVGWSIQSFPQVVDTAWRDDLENMNLLDALEYSIVPRFYALDDDGVSSGWLKMMKSAIARIGYGFNSQRMVCDYFKDYYSEVASYAKRLEKDDYAVLRQLVAWRHDVKERFSTVKIQAVLVNGVRDGKIDSSGAAEVKLLLFSGKMRATELRIELLLLKDSNSSDIDNIEPKIISLQLVDKRDSGVLSYVAKFSLEDTGFYSYGIRVLPYNQGLLREQDVGVVYWG